MRSIEVRLPDFGGRPFSKTEASPAKEIQTVQFDRHINLNPAERAQFAAEGSFMRGELCFFPWREAENGEQWFYAPEQHGEATTFPSATDGPNGIDFTNPPMIVGGPVAVEFANLGKPPAHLMQQAAAAEPIDDDLDPEFREVLKAMEAAPDDDARGAIWDHWLLGDFA